MTRLTVSLPSLAAIVGSSVVLALVVMVSLKAGPIGVTEAEARIAASGRGNDPWRLRPSDVGATSSIGPPATAGGMAGDTPDARRVIRVVYPGLTGSR